jgi:hypothetical protein
MNDSHANVATQDERRKQMRVAVAAMLVPLFFAIGFATCIIGTYHQPHPNNIKVAVVGPPAQTAPVQAAIQHAGGSAFRVSQVATVDAATQAVRDRDLVAAFVPTLDPKQPATAIVATAGGRLVATATEGFLRVVAAHDGAQLVVQDVRTLPSGDEIGLGVFLFLIIMTIAGYLAATVLQTAASDLPPSRRYPLLLAGAVLVPTLVYLIAGLGFGTYNGSAGTIFAFIGVGALYTFVVGLVTRLFQVLLGPPALFVSLAIFVFLNIPSLGATYTPNLLPSFWRFLNHFWLGAETVNAERSILYFDGDGVGTSILRLLAWAAVVVALLLLPIARKLMRARADEVSGSAARPVDRVAT